MRLSFACFDPKALDRWRPELEQAGTGAILLATPRVTPAPDGRAWSRAISELALAQWVLLSTRHAADALLDEAGYPGGPVLRIAAVDEAAEVLARVDRTVDEVAPDLGTLLARLAPRLGRRQRVLAPHAAGAGRKLGGWLEDLGAEAVCVAAYDYTLDAGIVAASGSSDRVVGLACSAIEAESLATSAHRQGGDLTLVALGAGAADAARDCGCTQVLLIEHLPRIFSTLRGLLPGSQD